MTVTELHPLTLGGSDFAALAGFDPYCTPYALGCRKLGLTSEPQLNDAMRAGLRLQEAHAEMVAEAGFDVLPAPAAGFVHPEHEWIVGHPDYLIALDGQRAPLELKLSGVALSDALITKYTIQTSVYMDLLAASVGKVSVISGGYGGIVHGGFDVQADAELVEMLYALGDDFRQLLLRGKLPAPSGSDSDRDAIRAHFAHAEAGKTVRLSQAEWGHVKRIRELDEVIDKAKKQRERHAQLVQAVMGDATEAVSPFDTPAARWRKVTSTRTDTKALKAAHPEIAGEFAKTTTYRKFEANP